MATTTNFGWETPDDTDLVKDGALAIRTLGNSIDTSLVDLKGGTTGQVLSKNSNTDMDFTWVTSDDANAIQNAIVDAKGDLIAASAADTPARLAVGNNGETLVADSSTSTGLRYQPTQAAGKNYVINGGFDIWQRGTSSATNGGYLTADRWNFDSSNCTKSQQSSGAPNGSRYYLRNAFTGASAYATALHFIETANTAYLWGKTVTLSVKLRRNASMSSNLYMTIRKNATVDAGPATASWSEISAVTITNASLPTGTTSADWYTASLTVTIPNDGTANSISFYVATVTAQGSGAQWEMAQAQLEIGSVATEFSRAGGTLAGELAACQRYFVRLNTSTTTFIGQGQARNGTIYGLFGSVPLPVTMRVAPSLSQSSLRMENNAGTAFDITQQFTGRSTPNNAGFFAGQASNFAADSSLLLLGATSTAYLDASSEL